MKLTLRKLTTVAAAAAVTLFGLTAGAFAAGPLINCQPGVPWAYANGGVNVAYHTDQGPLGPLTSAMAVAQTDAGFAAWEAVPTSTVTFVNGGFLPVNVTTSNFLPWFSSAAPDGLSPVVYDDNGAIFSLLFGANSGVLGFSGPEWGVTAACTITESVTFVNGGVLNPPFNFPVSEMQCVQHHEFGHFINLAHSVVNEQIAAFNDFTGPAPNDTFGFPVNLANKLETMSPFMFVNGGQCDAHRDDAASVSNIYPEPAYVSTTASITGHILAPNAITQLTGVNVIARNVADPFEDAVSALSSDRTENFTQGAPFVGQYTLNNLTPGADYAIYTDGIIAGGFSTPPAVPLPGFEEFYNGPGESSDPDTDDPSVYTTVRAAAGSQATEIDIIFNKRRPGDPLPLDDDSTIQLFLPFEFAYCGETWTSIFVNSNGSLTFGSGDTDETESAAEHLSDQPRIAGVWDDLNPVAGGIVTYFETNKELTISFQDVPEFPAAGSNSFDITLSRSSDHVTIEYGAISAADGLAGLSCGGLKTTRTETERDLTADQANATEGSINSRNVAAWYEVFTTLDNDLDDVDLHFSTPNAFKDSFESNDDFGSAKPVQLPFNSGDRRGDSMNVLYTEISPAGDDVDWYRFTADTGTTLIAEIKTGALDSYIGLFDDAGNLLAFDNDGGVGRLSKFQYPVTASGTYRLAVTTFPDPDFSGDGGGTGRYVLDLKVIHGTLLTLGDDTTLSVPIANFAFPFQGNIWTRVFANSNGNLTFGIGSTDHTESVAEFLSGPPRIAMLWDDLNPVAGGSVILDQTATTFTVTYDGVPEFTTTGTGGGANTFAVTLHSNGQLTVAYGATNNNDGLAGVTQGGGAPNPGGSDLSTSAVWPATGTTYQLFGTAAFDLSNSTLTYIP